MTIQKRKSYQKQECNNGPEALDLGNRIKKGWPGAVFSKSD